jgi:hypothetical protein
MNDGDEIILPLGASAPFVLRLIFGATSITANPAPSSPQVPDSRFRQRKRLDSVREAIPAYNLKNNGKLYMLISDCYVEGVMNGELDRMIKSRQTMTKEYRIR